MFILDPNHIFYTGAALCVIALIGVISTMIIMRAMKKRIDIKFDGEYGTRGYD